MVLCECVGQVLPSDIRMNNLVIERVEELVLRPVRIVELVGEVYWTVGVQLHLLYFEWLSQESFGQICRHSIKSLRIMFEHSFIQFFIVCQLNLLLDHMLMLLLCLGLYHGYCRGDWLFVFALPILQMRDGRLRGLTALGTQSAYELFGVVGQDRGVRRRGKLCRLHS